MAKAARAIKLANPPGDREIGILDAAQMHLLERTSASERAEPGEVVSLREANESLYIRVIEDGVAQGEFRNIDARLMAKPLLGALNWTSRWYQPRARETAAARGCMAREIADFVVAGLSPS